MCFYICAEQTAVSAFLCAVGMVYRLPTAGAGRPRGKTGKTGRTGIPVPPAPPFFLFTGIFFNTCAVGAPKTRTSHRRRVSDRFVGRGWRELQRREKTKTANALPA